MTVIQSGFSDVLGFIELEYGTSGLNSYQSSERSPVQLEKSKPLMILRPYRASEIEQWRHSNDNVMVLLES